MDKWDVIGGMVGISAIGAISGIQAYFFVVKDDPLYLIGAIVTGLLCNHVSRLISSK